GPRSNKEIEQLYSESRAFIFPGVEDFGITPLEAMASGLPVIAYGKAGVLETVVAERTGLLFTPQTASALSAAILRLESGAVLFDENVLRQRAAEFSKARFCGDFMRVIQRACNGRFKKSKFEEMIAKDFAKKEGQHDLSSGY